MSCDDHVIHSSRLAKSVNVLKDLVQYAMSLVEEEEQEGEEEEVSHTPHICNEYH